MPTYTIELTAEQLKALSQMTMWAECWKLHSHNTCPSTCKEGHFNDAEAEVFMKVSDQMERYYDSKGIVD